MLRNRVIPCLLLKGKGFVKTVNFNKPVYLGDPLNILNIFNKKMVDEIIILDITASHEMRPPNFELIHKLTSVCFSPMTYGGGISSVQEAEKLFGLGVEKICLNTNAFSNPVLLKELSKRFGNQSIVVSLNISKNLFGKYNIVNNDLKQIRINITIPETIKYFEELGVGEILINDVNRDGLMIGYDLNLLKIITSVSTIPIIACGGSANLIHFKEAILEANVSAVAAGSQFVFNGKHKAVLISYPQSSTIKNLLN